MIHELFYSSNVSFHQKNFQCKPNGPSNNKKRFQQDDSIGLLFNNITSMLSLALNISRNRTKQCIFHYSFFAAVFDKFFVAAKVDASNLIALSFVGKREARRINTLWRKKDKYPNVLSFKLHNATYRENAAHSSLLVCSTHEDENANIKKNSNKNIVTTKNKPEDIPVTSELLGEIFLCLPVVAHFGGAANRVCVWRRIVRLLAHSFCHVLGFDHESASDAAKMAAIEKRLFAAGVTVLPKKARGTCKHLLCKLPQTFC